MSEDTRVVTGIYAHPIDAAEAINGLEARGFREGDVSLLMSEGRGSEFKLADSTKMPEGAAAGAVGGGIIGALMAGLTAVGTLTATGGVILIAGPLVAALAGAGAGAGAGGLIGGLVGYGISEYEAAAFADNIEDGKVLVAVRCADKARQETAERVLANAGAESTSRA
jgi:hypothetical protein